MNASTLRRLPLVFAAALAGCAAADKGPPWTSLFDGKTMGQWQPTKFGGEAEVRVENGQIVLNRGDDMTGVTWSGAMPKMNYEVSLEAARLEGSDFFCALTFPVGESPCTFVVGGWSGSVVGLSCLDGEDASRNDTTQVMDFDDKRWYRVRVRVTPAKIEAWIDDKKTVDVETKGRKISIRDECELSRPLGIATWRTTAGLRDLKIRKLD